jgi:hypothetical protein
MSCGGHSAVPKVEHASAGWSSVAPSGRSDTARRQSSRRRHDAKAQKAGTARKRQGRSLDQRPLLARRLCTRYWSPLLAGVTGRGHARGGAPEPACRSIWGREPMSERRSRFGPLAAASETVRTAIASVDLRRSKRELPLKEAVGLRLQLQLPLGLVISPLQTARSAEATPSRTPNLSVVRDERRADRAGSRALASSRDERTCEQARRLMANRAPVPPTQSVRGNSGRPAESPFPWIVRARRHKRRFGHRPLQPLGPASH